MVRICCETVNSESTCGSAEVLRSTDMLKRVLLLNTPADLPKQCAIGPILDNCIMFPT
eukprot:Ihof_evm4s205 gene=Ihof_evmTU4s205